MKWVIDASFVAALFLPDESSERVSALANDLVKEELEAPSLLQLEISNLLIGAARRKRISHAQMRELSEAVEAMPIVYHPALTLPQRTEVIRLAEKHILTAYDAAYLELAMRLGAGLLTLDKSLTRAATAEKINMPTGLN